MFQFDMIIKILAAQLSIVLAAQLAFRSGFINLRVARLHIKLTRNKPSSTGAKESGLSKAHTMEPPPRPKDLGMTLVASQQCPQVAIPLETTGGGMLRVSSPVLGKPFFFAYSSTDKKTCAMVHSYNIAQTSI